MEDSQFSIAEGMILRSPSFQERPDRVPVSSFYFVRNDPQSSQESVEIEKLPQGKLSPVPSAPN